ncbi:hypothetical protein SAMN04487925_103803 [Bradyrhizobium sp. cf659]|nr:hypothetical protein [Bradyrhizobium sp. cf659]SFI71127.1 hypothetical protein SAMN04487925_103803 [Bradyrhizobium sp. cf659]
MLLVRTFNAGEQDLEAGLERRVKMRRLKIRRSGRKMLEVRGDRFVRDRFRRGRTAGVARRLIQCRAREVIAEFPKIDGRLAVGKAGVAQAFNYGDLPIWDMLLGTFRNPASFEGAVGFDKPATDRFGAMLTFADVNEPAAGAGQNSLGRRANPAS